VHTTSQYIYFNFSTCFEQLCAHHQENLVYLCDTGIFCSIWVAVWPADQTATHQVPPDARYFLIYLFQILYMFRATMCPSSGELSLSMRHWYFPFCMCGCLVCREVEINILRTGVHPVGLIWKRLYTDAKSTKHKTQIAKSRHHVSLCTCVCMYVCMLCA